MRDGGWTQPETGQAGLLPLLQQIGQLDWRTGENTRVRAVPGTGEGIQPRLSLGRLPRIDVEEDDKVAENVQRLILTAGGSLFRADLLIDRACLAGIMRGHVHDIGCPRSEPVGDGGMREYGDQRLALRRARRDRRTADLEPSPREVDMVQLVAVDEPPGCRVADLSVVLPAVPQPADHLNVVGGLVKQIPDQLGDLGRIPVREPERGDIAPADMSRLGLGRADLDARAGTAGADIVEGGDRCGDVERLGMGDPHGRYEPDAAGPRGDPGGDQNRVEASADLVRAAVRAVVTRGLPRQRVLDRHKIEQAAFGLLHQVDPIAGGEQLVGPGIRFPPRRGMPTRAVKRNGEVQFGRCGHRVSSCSDWVLP